MTRYDETFKGIPVLFEKEDVQETLGELLSKLGKKQIRIAETEKYPHVTFFFNGGREEPFEGESRILIPSPKVATYDLQPEMSAPGITQAIIAAMREQQPDFICLNYANTDMVGHTGVFEAAVSAAETVDACLGELLEAAGEKGYAAVIIADHGNSDFMINADGSPNTAHTKNPVPCILVSDSSEPLSLAEGRLADVAPTLLDIMGIPQPEAMTGHSLIKK
jgi:2,3-bisphosphoglycerate-independent phosphoglycerate mutase